MNAVQRDDVQKARPAEIAALPFRVKKAGPHTFLEYDADVGYGRQTFGPLFAGTSIFVAVTLLMEMFRAVERREGSILQERDGLLAEVARHKEREVSNAAKIAELERRLARTKKGEA